MNRSVLLLALLGAVLLVAVWFAALFNPKRGELAEVEDQILAVEDEQARLRTRIVELEQLRERAPEIEALLAAGEAFMPSGPDTAPALRQLQLVALDSGVVVDGIDFAPPSPAAQLPTGIAEVGVTANVNGGYFQVLDFLRRIEDPAITARGMLWDLASVAQPNQASADGAPVDAGNLTVTLNGRMFAQVPVAAVAPPPADTDGAGEDADDPAEDTEDPDDPTLTSLPEEVDQ